MHVIVAITFLVSKQYFSKMATYRSSVIGSRFGMLLDLMGMGTLKQGITL